MELFEKYTEIKKWKGKLAKMMRDEWMPRVMIQQYVIDINEKRVLHEICKKDDDELMAECLCTPGIDVNAEDYHGWTALMHASKVGSWECVKILCETEGIDINAKDNYKWTALIWASVHEYYNCIKILCNMEGMEINAKCVHGRTALHYLYF